MKPSDILRTKDCVFLENQLNRTLQHMTWHNYAVSRRIMRNCVAQQKKIKLSSHLIVEATTSIYNWKKAYTKSVSFVTRSQQWKTSSDHAVNSANPRLDGRELFYSRPVVGSARGFLKGCRHARSRQPSPSVDTICSPPFWDRYLIGIQLVQNCYIFIASWLTSQMV